ncbi:MAG: dehydrogenase [ubiquinone] 1 alpha subcomplex assembly factor 7 [Aliidongia sp.]|nr:dehydrogenase [ubiquinone] 1 alpha subcomplex assembly factor 7 [Aliidongia sp.]
MTPLGQNLADLIRRDGPIGVDRFMATALGDPVHGYYMTRDPLGVAGDFITAPEISQIFGEIVGLWCADQWQQIGCPDPVHLAELGPGRGTLMADLLRALAVLPPLRAAIRLHLVETSPVLRDRQRARLSERHPDLTPRWHEHFDTVPTGPLLLIANEFFDALPIRQWQNRTGVWHERRIGLDAEGDFTFTLGPPARPPIAPPPAGEDAIFETAEAGLAVAAAIGRRLAACPGAALIIDYGHARTAVGETLQAVRRHRPIPVLDLPGEADLTAHVDFAALAGALAVPGVRCWGPVTQRQFLSANGAAQRVAALTRGKPEAEAAAIGHAAARLLDPAQMGSLFKVLAAIPADRPAPSGFDPASGSAA